MPDIAAFPLGWGGAENVSFKVEYFVKKESKEQEGNLKVTSVRFLLAAAHALKASPSIRSSVTSNLYLTVSRLALHCCFMDNQILISGVIKMRYQITDMTEHPRVFLITCSI